MVIAGPCSVESREQLLETAGAVKKAGAHILRGGAYKPRTSPYRFQGMEEEGLKLLAEASEVTGLPVVTEVINPADVELVAKYVHMLQVGARNVQNFASSRRSADRQPGVAQARHEVDDPGAPDGRGVHPRERNHDVILCERGIRTFERRPATRWTSRRSRCSRA